MVKQLEKPKLLPGQVATLMLSKREEVRRTGIYLLVGLDPDDPSRAPASIGEGDNLPNVLPNRA